MTEPRKKRGRRWLVPTGGLAALAIVAVGILGVNGVFDSAPRDLNGKPVSYDLDAEPNPKASATPDGSGQFIARSVGLDVPLGSLDAVDGEVTPPGFTSAYLIRNYGVIPQRAASGTVYVVMHSLRNGAIGPGNALIDVEKKRANIALGATIDVDDVTYRVDSTEVITKKQLPTSSIWDSRKNELVVITCLQRPQGGVSVENLVITARKTS